MDIIQVDFERLYSGQLPTYAHDDDTCMDLYAREEAVLMPGEVVLVPAGFKVAVPSGHGMFIYSRSGLAMNRIVVNNAPGVIDPGYRGEVRVQLRNDRDTAQLVKAGDRIAQASIQKTPHVTIVEGTLDDTERGENGFGSTGR